MKNYDSKSFYKEVLTSEIPILIDFWAPWCAPCKRLEPVLEEIAAEFKGKIGVGKVDIDENMNLAQNYGIMSIPAICLFQNGKLVFRLNGFHLKSKISAQINKYLGFNLPGVIKKANSNN